MQNCKLACKLKQVLMMRLRNFIHKLKQVLIFDGIAAKHAKLAHLLLLVRVMFSVQAEAAFINKVTQSYHAS